MGIEATEAEEGAEAAQKTFKPFTKSYYRENLKIRTGLKGEGMDAHHIFPQAKKFEVFFRKAGLNIHDPKYLSWWEKVAHNSAAKAYNKAWSKFIFDNPNASIKEIEKFGNSLMKNHGF